MPVCPETERFAALLRSLKSRSGLSYEALARKSGLAGSTLHRYCRGTSVPQDYGSIHRLATVCGATPEELRTLHRLWALADAARAAAAAAAEETAEGEPEAEERGHGTEEVGAPPAPDRPSDPEGTAVTGRQPEGTALTGRQPEGTAATDHPGTRPDARPGTRPDAGSHRRLRVTVVAAVLLATVGAASWALSNSRASSDSDGGGHGTGDSRPLFSAGCPTTIAMGEHDACVKEVQRLLHTKGADIDVDGDFGPQTLRRVTAFQVFAGLQPNGVVEEPTKKALYTSRVRMTVWPEEKVRKRVREVFPEAPDKAVAIADCQSFLDPLHILPNTNGTRNWGLFQISDARLRDLGGTPRQALDPEWNIQAARKLWSKKHDFHDWPHCARAAGGSTPSPTPHSSS
ncbi:helix-turn-helix domain-containing protein [Streptomyces sp. NPDC006372]|uniref:helix-turn-helix domain-containing protein n=1 Tax=Streptomyces sp. NPDC006372 TaxID=3155599 RepID=UPI0033A126FB